MKRTSFFLASITAMALLSCSNDNLNSLAEDVNLSQTQALQKAPVEITPYGTGSVTGSIGTMSISNLATGSTGGSLYATAKIPSSSYLVSKTEVCPGTFNTGIGSFTLQSMTVICGGAKAILTTSGSCVTTSAFNGKTVPTTCDVYFTGKCTSGGPCSKMMSGARMVVSYQF